MRLLKRPELGEVIGRGRNGSVVHVGEDPIHGKVAVKVFHFASFYNPEQCQRLKAIVLEEGKRQSEVKHENLVRVHYAYEDPDDPGKREAYLVMEYLGNGTLQDQIKDGPIPLRQLQPLLHDITCALSAVHATGAFHLDVKPDNILLDSKGRAKLGDFGAATRNIKEGFARRGGYNRHWAPEVEATGYSDVRAEIWALGMTAYRLANGERFYRRVSETTRLDPKFSQNLKWLPHIPKEWRRVIARALIHDPARRTQNAEEFHQGISKLPAPLDWVCKTGHNEFMWTRKKKGGRLLTVAWEKPFRERSGWSAFTTRGDGTGQKYALGGSKSNAEDTSKVERDLVEFFEAEARKK